MRNSHFVQFHAIVLEITEKNKENINAYFFTPLTNYSCFLDVGKDFFASALCLLPFASGVVERKNLKWQI